MAKKQDDDRITVTRDVFLDLFLFVREKKDHYLRTRPTKSQIAADFYRETRVRVSTNAVTKVLARLDMSRIGMGQGGSAVSTMYSVATREAVKLLCIVALKMSEDVACIFEDERLVLSNLIEAEWKDTLDVGTLATVVAKSREAMLNKVPAKAPAS